jgi:hypothetical protein
MGNRFSLLGRSFLFLGVISAFACGTHTTQYGQMGSTVGTALSQTPEAIATATPIAMPTPESSPVGLRVSPLQTLLGDCYTSALNEPIRTDLVVNGHTLMAVESKNIQWTKKCVLPFLPGTLADRIKNVSEVSWWALREGVLGLANNRLFRYSLCHEPVNGDRRHDTEPLYASRYRRKIDYLTRIFRKRYYPKRFTLLDGFTLGLWTGQCILRWHLELYLARETLLVCAQSTPRHYARAQRSRRRVFDRRSYLVLHDGLSRSSSVRVFSCGNVKINC